VFVYIDVLLTWLREAGMECFVSGWSVEAMAYADDLVLFTPTAMAMRRMLSICNSYAIEFHMSFHASKTKSVVFRPRHYLAGAKSVFPSFCFGVCGSEIVDQWSHLRYVTRSKGDDQYDILRYRNSYIGQVNILLGRSTPL